MSHQRSIASPWNTRPPSFKIPPGHAGTDPAAFPADWLLVHPDERGGDWARVVVHEPLTAWHDVYLIGLAVVAAGIAIRSRVGRRLMVIGVVVIGVGVVGQAAVTPDGASGIEVPQ